MAEIIHDAIDAAVNDLNRAFLAKKCHRSSLSWSCFSAENSVPVDNDSDSMMGEMSDEDEDRVSTDKRGLRMKLLQQIVREEMEELAEGLREAVDEAF